MTKYFPKHVPFQKITLLLRYFKIYKKIKKTVQKSPSTPEWGVIFYFLEIPCLGFFCMGNFSLFLYSFVVCIRMDAQICILYFITIQYYFIISQSGTTLYIGCFFSWILYGFDIHHACGSVFCGATFLIFDTERCYK